MARGRPAKPALGLPVSAEGFRAQRLRAELAGARASGWPEADIARMRSELDAVQHRLGLQADADAEAANRREAGLGRAQDVISRLFEAGKLSPDQARTADRIAATLEALHAGGVRSVDFGALEAGAGASRDPTDGWRRGRAVSAGAPPRSFGYRRVREARTGGDGVSEQRADMLGRARSLNRTLEALRRAGEATAARVRDDLAAGGRGFVQAGEVWPETADVIRLVVVEGASISASARCLIGYDGQKARKRIMRALLQGLDIVAQNSN